MKWIEERLNPEMIIRYSGKYNERFTQLPLRIDAIFFIV